MGAIDHDLIAIPATTAELGLAPEAVEALAAENIGRARLQGITDFVRNTPDEEPDMFRENRAARRAGDPQRVRIELLSLIPRQRVDVPPFQIDRTRVSNRQYAEFLRASGRKAPPFWDAGRIPAGWERYAVTNVSHDDAATYASWAGLSLPIEHEWQIAAGAADGRRYPWGDQLSPVLEEIRTKPAGDTPVDAHPELGSPYGVLDLVSNFWEWCSDVFAPLPGGDVKAFHETYPSFKPTWRALRGGHAYTMQWGTHVRKGDDKANTDQPHGFRCVKR